jgi:hypothetical protein
MTYQSVDTLVGASALTGADATQMHRYGTIVQGYSTTYGTGEFIYLKGVSSNFAGALVTYVASTGVTALSTTSGVLTGGAPMAVSMSAATGSEWGWFCISGDVLMYKTAVKFDPAAAPGQRVTISATAGRIMQTSVAGRAVQGARFAATATVTSTTSTVVVTLNRPSQQKGALL